MPHYESRCCEVDRVFSRKVEAMLKEKVLLAFSTSRINDGTNFKDNFGSTPSAINTRKKKLECWRVHVETIKSQQLKVKRAISKILKEIPKHMCGMELRFMPQMRYDVDSKQNKDFAMR